MGLARRHCWELAVEDEDRHCQEDRRCQQEEVETVHRGRDDGCCQSFLGAGCWSCLMKNLQLEQGVLVQQCWRRAQ